MSGIKRNTSTPEGKAFWEQVDLDAAIVGTWEGVGDAKRPPTDDQIRAALGCEPSENTLAKIRDLTAKLAAAEAEIKSLKAALTSAPADGDVSEVKTNEEPQ